jgi:hypothetical protein
MHKRTLAAVLLATAVPVTAFAAGSAPHKKITGRGIGAVKLGASYTDLRDAGLVGKPLVGCEVAGPTKDAATLKKASSLRGNVSFSPDKIITNVTIFKGASVRGVGPGSTLDEVTAAYPDAKVSRTLVKTFHLIEVRVAKKDGGPFTFGIDTDAGKTASVGIPSIPTCD